MSVQYREIYIVEMQVRNKPSLTLPIYLSKIRERLIIFQNMSKRQIILTVTGTLSAITEKPNNNKTQQTRTIRLPINNNPN